MKRLIIARHGNTFRPGETPTRVGAGTDLPLVEETRARSIGRYLKDKGLTPDRVLAAPLKRTMQTAALALEEAGLSLPILPMEDFREIDYGPDENRTEDEVMERLGRLACPAEASHDEIMAKGQEAIELWNANGTVPSGWRVDPAELAAVWKKFAADIRDGETVLVVSSNGVIRFAPHITEGYDDFCAQYDIKTATGGVCIFENAGGVWECREWNVKPFKMYA